MNESYFVEDFTSTGKYPYTKRNATSKIIGYVIENGINLTEQEEEWLERYSHNQAVKLAGKLKFKVNYKL